MYINVMNSKLIKAFLYTPKPGWILYILVRKKETRIQP